MADGSDWDSSSLPAALRRAMRDRHEGVDAVADDIQRELQRIADRLGDELKRHIEGVAGSTSAAEIKAAVQATELQDVLDILRAAGLDKTQQAWIDGLQGVAERAANAVGTAGLDASDRTLDVEAVDAALRARYVDMSAAWDARVKLPLADRLLAGLHNMVLAETLEDASKRLAETARITVQAAHVEVVTQTAMFDRFVAAEVTRYADPDAEALWAYVGPEDGITRPFCDALVGRAFPPSELPPLNNQQTAEHPIFACGGYNCRHAWVPMLPANLGRYGLDKGTPADIKGANAAAIVARFGKKGPPK